MSLTDAERVLSRARSLLTNGKARGWSHALAVAADSLGERPMSTTLPTRAAVERAADLDFDRPGRGQPNRIAIELAPDGLHITVSYDGQISGIPAAVKRLLDAGLLDLVAQHQAAPTAAPAPTRKSRAERVEPTYNDAGDPCCPKHRKVLREGKFGRFCPAKDDTTERGYCALKFDA